MTIEQAKKIIRAAEREHDELTPFQQALLVLVRELLRQSEEATQCQQ